MGGAAWVRRWLAFAVLATTVVGCGGGDRATVTGGEAVLLAAGDIAECSGAGDEATAEILARHPNATIAPLGDLAYPHGRPQDFRRCFGPSWGRFLERMRPATGNHDHATPDARGYWQFFGRRGGPFDRYMYAYDIGSWRAVVLNSDCWRIGGCALNDPQARWFRAELRRNPRQCTLVYWHRPPFSSGRYGDPEDTARVRPLWRIAAAEGVDVVLTGHEHSYERFRPMGADGRPDPVGPRLFIVGTGGAELRPYTRPRLPTTAVRHGATLGLLRLHLRAGSYDWRFVPARRGGFTDQGSGTCR